MVRKYLVGESQSVRGRLYQNDNARFELDILCDQRVKELSWRM